MWSAAQYSNGFCSSSGTGTSHAPWASFQSAGVYGSPSSTPEARSAEQRSFSCRRCA